MKIINFKHLNNYNFRLQFENNEIFELDLQSIISAKVSLDELKTARIDKDWGCLEFKNGMVDIEPKTLYNFCKK
jgi:Protein of unknown function (DUF2442)